MVGTRAACHLGQKKHGVVCFPKTSQVPGEHCQDIPSQVFVQLQNPLMCSIPLHITCKLSHTSPLCRDVRARGCTPVSVPYSCLCCDETP